MSGDGSLVHDRARIITSRRESIAPARGVEIDRIERAHHQRAHIELRRAPDQQPVRIDQHHLAIGVDPPEDLARALPQDAVEGYG